MSEDGKILSNRKTDHIDLAFDSQVLSGDERFNYEPLTAFNLDGPLEPVSFAGLQMNAPWWVSSMTGGAEKAGRINERLAKACAKYGLGMGLGSCRPVLENTEFGTDFLVRKWIGNQPLFANLGIAQLEEIAETNAWPKLKDMIARLEANGLIIHINPLQEWMQPEGDDIRFNPLETIKRTIDALDCSIIVKEVGQGFGPESLRALIKLPLAALDYGSLGGTNFSKLEYTRGGSNHMPGYEEVTRIGHTAHEMTTIVNRLMDELGSQCLCKNSIVSGGIRNFLDGYYHVTKSKMQAIYAQASPFLKYALQGEESLHTFIESQLAGYKMANRTLKIKQ